MLNTELLPRVEWSFWGLFLASSVAVVRMHSGAFAPCRQHSQQRGVQGCEWSWLCMHSSAQSPGRCLGTTGGSCFVQSYFSLWGLEANRDLLKCGYTQPVKLKLNYFGVFWFLVLVSFLFGCYLALLQISIFVMVPLQTFFAKTFWYYCNVHVKGVCWTVKPLAQNEPALGVHEATQPIIALPFRLYLRICQPRRKKKNTK